jgi:fluoroacetyl-CoA thioesterase
MKPGDSADRSFTVTPRDTAQALGSGDLPVLATPRLLAWCEEVTCVAVEGSLEATQTSVGTRVQLDHLVASPVGATVRVTASVTHVDGRLVRFEVVAHEDRLVAHGEVTRVVVDRDRFLSRLSR